MEDKCIRQLAKQTMLKSSSLTFEAAAGTSPLACPHNYVCIYIYIYTFVAERERDRYIDIDIDIDR